MPESGHSIGIFTELAGTISALPAMTDFWLGPTAQPPLGDGIVVQSAKSSEKNDSNSTI